jgi:hypothetical protein
MKWALRIYSFILLAYTGWRTYDFISSTLPKNDISFWLSIAFLFSSEAGLLLWHEMNLAHVSTETQEQIAKWMTWVDFVASLAAGVADMILRQTFIEGFSMPPILGQFLIYGLPAIMALNVAAVLQYQANDADTQMEREKRKVNFKIRKEALKDLKDASEEIAKDKKTLIYRHLRDQVTGQVDRAYMSGSKLSDNSNGNGQGRPVGQGSGKPKFALIHPQFKLPSRNGAETKDGPKNGHRGS